MSKEQIIHKDIFGNLLGIGDEVAINQPKYKGLIKGEIIKLTPSCIRVRYLDHCKHEQETIEYPSNAVKNLNK